jgi:subtilisin family serine protease
LSNESFPVSLRVEEQVKPADITPTDKAGDNIVYTKADQVWSQLGITGKGIIIGAQDTGYQFDHPALVKQYRGNTNGKFDHNYNWHDAVSNPLNGQVSKCGYKLAVPCDDDQHGTHTLGTMVGLDGNKKIGMAPDAKWIGCRNMGAGFGSPSTYIDCFQFFLAPYPIKGNPLTDGKPDLAPHVINNSWACPPNEGCKGWEIYNVVEALTKAGVLVVVSAGNEGSSCWTIANPAAQYSLNTLTVGALDHRNSKIADFSSRGPSKFDGGIGPDVTAPGVNVLSSVPGGRYEQANWSGTSMAGPHVVGLVALMLSANPKLIGNLDAITDIIRKTATPLYTNQTCGGLTSTSLPNNTFGYGAINALTAVKSALVAAP